MASESLKKIEVPNTPQLDISYSAKIASIIQGEMEQKAMEKVIENQNEYIDLLQEQNSISKKQLEIADKQLKVITEMFSVEENSLIVERELMELIRDEIDSKHPLWEYVKDKGGDVMVAGVPVLYKAIKMYLISKGIVLP